MFTGNITLGTTDLYNEFGIIAVNLSNGMIETHTGVTQDIIEEKSMSLDKPYFLGVDRKPITFSMNFARVDNEKWDYQTKLKFSRLIFEPNYRELKSADYPQVVYNVICVDEPKKVLNGVDQGYITLNFRCDAPWGWSPATVVTKNISGASDENPYVIELENNSNVLQWYYPEVEFKTLGTTNFKMSNNKDGGRDFIFTDIYDGEVIYVNNDIKKVIGDQPYPLKYRLDKFNKNWFRLKYGKNKINIYTDCIISFKMKYPVAI